ncbi:hypothetical protein [Legionella pneumophila]|nr:hypothetical protein [Legionella pneumophila]AMP88880.1 hypothetical protein AXF35_03900 [Legionella pneumophila subsp. pascullei]AMP93452.1 hypothetical protein AXF36_12890 [Legionella pneumophila subsp. pascullei]AMP96420.1 hypothetical protein AXF37_12785 [Legionella pneumophila subsp. pascullei]HAT6917321.1 hypothetical protein [Legionella pneumophila]HAT6919763.1 hypothetical protein [Legionella pneumophila]
MFLKFLLLGFMFYPFGYSLASIPKDVIESCKKGSAVGRAIVVTDLGNIRFIRDSNDKCNNLYLTGYKGKYYGFISCHDKPYFIIDKKKYAIADAVIESEKPYKPSLAILTDGTYWLKIDDSQRSYLCVRSPSDDFGGEWNRSIALSQFYIAANAFDKKEPVKLYFYYYHPELMNCMPAVPTCANQKICQQKMYLCPQKSRFLTKN